MRNSEIIDVKKGKASLCLNLRLRRALSVSLYRRIKCVHLSLERNKTIESAKMIGHVFTPKKKEEGFECDSHVKAGTVR